MNDNKDAINYIINDNKDFCFGYMKQIINPYSAEFLKMYKLL